MCIINHRFEIVSGSGNFKALSNFKIEIEVEMAAPTGILGYIVILVQECCALFWTQETFSPSVH